MLATVFGDVHDIGKNLVGTILSNNGYRVVDLGRQVPLNVIMDSAVAEHADAIGLSALLVSTSKQMPLALHELDHRGLHVPVLVGGAAINRAFGRRIAFLDDGRMYEPGVFYCKDAFEGLGVMDRLSDAELRGGLIAERREQAVADRDTPKPAPAAEPAPARAGRATLRADVAVPEPPFLGARLVDAIDPAAMFALHGRAVAVQALVGRQGRARRRLGAAAGRRLRAAPGAHAGARRSSRAGSCRAPHTASSRRSPTATTLWCSTPTAASSARFEFPRQDRHDRLCISDYLREGGGGRDVIALQLVTAGAEATEHIDALQAAGEYSEAYFAHGLAVEAAEGLAEFVHRRILSELGLEAGRGRRYSWGYPACPDLEQHELVLRLLPPAAELGVELSAAFQFIPEQTTAAIVIHHPQAIYFSARRGIRSGGE